MMMMMYLFTTVTHPHGHWQLQELFGNHYVWESLCLGIILFMFTTTDQDTDTVTDKDTDTLLINNSIQAGLLI